jgi:hypothetical protein
LRDNVAGADYATTRARAEEYARTLETRYTTLLEPGLGLRVVFAQPDADTADQDLDFDVVIAPNTETVPGTIVIVGENVYTVWVVDELRIQVAVGREDDPAYGVLIRRDASAERVREVLIGPELEIEKAAARDFITELQNRGILVARTLYISFAQTGPGVPLEYLRENLKLGRASRAARTVPTGASRDLLVDRGTTAEGEQRESLSDYASVFWESYVGQFTSRQVQSDPTQGGIIATEFVWLGEGQPRVINLGIVRVGADGSIVEIVETTPTAGTEADFVATMRRAGWTVRLDSRTATATSAPGS